MIEEATVMQSPPDIVNALAASPVFAQDGLCFAAQNSGLYRSQDGGLSWHDAYASLAPEPAPATFALAISPSFVSDQSIFAGAHGGILRSSDAGLTWRTALLPQPAPLVSALVVSPAFEQDGIVFAGTLEDGVFRSADRGSSWAAWNFGLLDLGVLCLAISPDFAHDETLFAGTGSGLFRSTNGGRAWRELDFPIDWAPVLSIALVSGSTHHIYVGTELHGICYSQDAGISWQRIQHTIVPDTINAILVTAQPQAPATLVALPGNSVIVSRDGGNSWTDWDKQVSLGPGAASIVAPCGLDAGAALLVGLIDGQVLRL